MRNLNNDRAVELRVTDRVPLEALNNGRLLDVSDAAARPLEMVEDGVVPIEITVLGREYEEAQSVGHSLRLLGKPPLAPTLFRRFANLGRFVAPYGHEADALEGILAGCSLTEMMTIRCVYK